MYHPWFEEDIQMTHQDDDYDDYRTPDTSRIDDILFTVPNTTEVRLALRLRQKPKWDKIVSWYRYLDVTGDSGLAGLDRFMIRKKLKIGNIQLVFPDGNKHWQFLTNKQTGEFLAPKTLREKFGGLNIMKGVLSLDETPSTLKRSFKAAAKLKSELPTDLQM